VVLVTSRSGFPVDIGSPTGEAPPATHSELFTFYKLTCLQVRLIATSFVVVVVVVVVVGSAGIDVGVIIIIIY